MKKIALIIVFLLAGCSSSKTGIKEIDLNKIKNNKLISSKQNGNNQLYSRSDKTKSQPYTKIKIANECHDIGNIQTKNYAIKNNLIPISLNHFKNRADIFQKSGNSCSKIGEIKNVEVRQAIEFNGMLYLNNDSFANFEVTFSVFSDKINKVQRKMDDGNGEFNMEVIKDKLVYGNKNGIFVLNKENKETQLKFESKDTIVDFSEVSKKMSVIFNRKGTKQYYVNIYEINNDILLKKNQVIELESEYNSMSLSKTIKTKKYLLLNNQLICQRDFKKCYDVIIKDKKGEKKPELRVTALTDNYFLCSNPIQDILVSFKFDGKEKLLENVDNSVFKEVFLSNEKPAIQLKVIQGENRDTFTIQYLMNK